MRSKLLNTLTFSRRLLHVSPIASCKNVQKSRFEDVPLSRKPYFDFVWENADKYADLVAIVNAVTGEKLTYKEAKRRSRNFGYNLRDGMRADKGDVLALLLPNCVEYPLIFAGASKIGVTLTTLNPIYTPSEIAKQLKLSKATFAATTPELYPKLKEALDKIEPDKAKRRKWNNRIVIVGGRVGEHERAELLLTCNNPLDFMDPEIDVERDVCILPYSSGTTGIPKGVMLTHFNLVANVCQAQLGPDEMKTVKFAHDSYQSSTLNVLPIFHMFAMNVTMTPTLYAGGKFVILPKFEPHLMVDALERFPPTFLHLAPPLVSFLASSPDVTPRHLASLEHIVAAAAPSGPALIKQFKSKAPHVVYREGWGMSETSPIVLMTPLNGERNGSCGILAPNSEAKVIDLNTGEALGPNQRGELCCRGPQNMLGYLDNPEATEATLQADGW